HFPTMVYRLKNNIEIDNPFISQIKREFGLMYNITWFVLSSFEKDLNINFNESEVGFLMIYFQSSLYRLKTSKKVLIICPTGITMSGILYDRVRNIIPPLDVIEIASFDDLPKIHLNEVDLIISTAHIRIEGPPVVVISPLLSKEEMDKISKFYNKYLVNDTN